MFLRSSPCRSVLITKSGVSRLLLACELRIRQNEYSKFRTLKGSKKRGLCANDQSDLATK